MSNIIINNYSFFELSKDFFNCSHELQVSIIADALRKGPEPPDLTDADERLLPIIAAAATRVLREITADVMPEVAAVTRGAFNLDKITSLSPPSEGSNPNAISIELLDKISKAVELLTKTKQAVAIANKLALPCPDNLLVNLNRLEDSIQRESNGNLQKIWHSRLYPALADLQKPQGLVIPHIGARAYAIRSFLNNPAHADFLEQLRELNLNFLGLTIFPSEIGRLRGIQNLHLVSNLLTSLPEEICDLTNLHMLDLEHNQLQGLPEGIGRLINLHTLDLEHNQLHELPQAIGNLTNLQALFLSNNQLEGLPEEIGSLSNLQKLYLNHNKLQWFPEAVCRLTNLEKLYFSHNRLQYLPPEIGELTNLQVLILSHNQLQLLPDTTDGLTNLQVLVLSNNQHDKTQLFIQDKLFELPRILKVRIFADKSHPISNVFASHFAQLYQSFLNDHFICDIFKSEIKGFFNKLSDREKNLVYGAVCEIAGFRVSNDLGWGKNNAFIDLSRLQKAVGLVITRKFLALSQDKKKLVYDQIWRLAGKPKADFNWGKRYAFDSLAFLAEAMAKPDIGACT